MLMSQLASQRFAENGDALELSLVDIRKAYFNAVPRRRMHLYLPREMGLGTKAIAHLKRCVYGTRDAGALWEKCYSEALVRMGFRRGLANPCCFYHPEKFILLVVHGDDFTATGSKRELDWLEKTTESQYELTVGGRLGPGPRDDKEARVLNRVVRWTAAGLEYEADPRQVERLIEELDLDGEGVK